MPKEEKGYWFSTENGTHIHAEEGESKESAMKKKFSKFGKKEESWKSDEDAIWEKFNKGEITEEERNKYLSERSGKIAKKDTTFEEINEKRMSGKTKKQSVFGESKVFSNLKEGGKYNFSDGGSLSSEQVDDNLKFLKSSLSEEQWNAIKDNKDYMEGYLKGKYNVGGLKMAANIALEDNSNDSFEEISEALADYQHTITDKTTVGDYAQRVGEKLGKSKEEILSVIRNENPDIKETDKMSVVAGLEEKQSTFDSINAKRTGTKEKPKYQTIADVSSSVKKELKEKGFNTKGISVRGRNVGYSDALDITIKDPNIDIDEVRKLVNKHESYERDASGDILQGGNRYVNVKYEYGLFDNIGEQNKEEATKLIEKVKSGNGSGIELGNKHYLFHDKRDGQTFIHSNEYGMTPIYSPERLGSYLYQIKKFGRIVGR